MKYSVQMKVFIFAIAAIFSLSSCDVIFPENKAVSKNFISLYSDKNTLDEFCNSSNSYYSIQIEIGALHMLSLILTKKDDGQWSGLLSNREEKIPLRVEGEALVIDTVPEKRVPLGDVLLFKYLDIEKVNIEKSSKENWGSTSELVTGSYPTDHIKLYMESFYEKIISCFSTFEFKEIFLTSINQLDYFENKRFGYELEENTLTFVFNGDEAANMFLTETY